jgi:phosphoserine phosphatase
MTSTNEPLWLFDLDGTIIDVNSFPLWVSEMLTSRVSVSLRAAAALAARKVLRQSHIDFKRRLQRLWAEAAPTGAADRALGALLERLMSHVRPSLETLLDDVRHERVDAVLTTAAAAEYALPLARQLGFRHAIATPPGGKTDAPDNVGQAKRDRTLAYLTAQGWAARPRILFTDHLDDLPLIRECQSLLWFGTPADYGMLRGELPGLETIAARELAADETYGWVETRTRRQGAACT